jgi:hypothetical protein
MMNHHFFGNLDEEKDYSQQLQECIEVVKKYPKSQYLISNLLGWRMSFKSNIFILSVPKI